MASIVDSVLTVLQDIIDKLEMREEPMSLVRTILIIWRLFIQSLSIGSTQDVLYVDCLYNYRL